MKQLSTKMFGILERLSEMFPNQYYYSELDQYITAREPQSVAEVDRLIREFETNNLTRKIS